MFDLKNKKIVVSGGYGYLGRVIVKNYINAGASVIILGKDQQKCEEAIHDFENKSNIHFEPVELTDIDSINKAHDNITSKFGHIDVLVNNAYAIQGRHYIDVSEDEWSYTIDNSLNSVFRCIKVFSSDMIKNQSGKIINVASIYGMVSPYFDIYASRPQYIISPQYAAVKGGIVQLTKYFAGLLGQYSINVNSISPGPFPNFNIVKDQEFIQELANKTMLKRIGTPEELAGVFCLLASDAASFITGQNIVVDGGWTAF